MLDIKFIKENKDIVEKAIKDRNMEGIDLDRLLEVYEERRGLRQEVSGLNERRNRAAEARDQEEGRRIKEELREKEEKLKGVEKEFISLMVLVPNIPSPDTPVGKDESANVVLREVGEKKEFSFKPLGHAELGKALDVIDNERAAKVSGARFTYLKGDLAIMQFALIKFLLDTFTNKETLEGIAREAGIDIEVTPFTLVLPPAMVQPHILNRMGRLEPREDKYYLEKDDMFLAGSAEQALGPMHMDEVFDEKDLPVRYIGYSTSFRREAGSYGKDTKGILRMHQFDKLEMEVFSLPENSYKEQDFIIAILEYFMAKLGLPYRVVMISTGDMGFPDHRQMDIEAWMPGAGEYKETHTSDLVSGFQARRLNTRVRRADGKMEHVHMNDATAFAMGRALISIMENYQQEDGSILVPEVLRNYMGKDTISNSKA